MHDGNECCGWCYVSSSDSTDKRVFICQSTRHSWTSTSGKYAYHTLYITFTFTFFWPNTLVSTAENLTLLLHLQGFLLILVCPFNIIYRSSRYRFLCVIRNIILSPLYKVVFPTIIIVESCHQAQQTVALIVQKVKRCSMKQFGFSLLFRLSCWIFSWLINFVVRYEDFSLPLMNSFLL